MLPSAAASTIFARSTNRAGVRRPRDQANNVRRSSFDRLMTGADFMGFILLMRMKPATSRK
jgi:hypothetical protein